MKKEKILVTAATGNVGQYVAKALLEKQIPFTAATRNANKAKEKLGSQINTIFVDFRDESSFGPALEGKDKLFLCGPAATPDADELLLPLAKEAKAQNIKHVVCIASYTQTMEFIKQSGMDYTFVRANFFMQNFEMYQTEDIRDRDQIFMPTGEGKAPFIHTRDIGEVAAKALEHPKKLNGESIYVTGPEALDHFKAAEIFSEVLGRKIEYENPTDDTYRKVMKQRGFSDSYIEAMINVFGKIRRGKVAQVSDTVEKVLGRKPIALKQYVEENKDYFTA